VKPSEEGGDCRGVLVVSIEEGESHTVGWCPDQCCCHAGEEGGVFRGACGENRRGEKSLTVSQCLGQWLKHEGVCIQGSFGLCPHRVRLHVSPTEAGCVKQEAL